MFEVQGKERRDLRHKESFLNVIEPMTPSFSGIVTGEGKGRLWLDDWTNPTVAIAESYCVGSYAFLGKCPDAKKLEELRLFLTQKLLSKEKANGATCFEFSIEHEALRGSILSWFGDRNIQQEKEFTFRCMKGNETKIVLPQGYELRKITKELWKRLKNHELGDPAFVIPRITESWYSFEEFEERSIGYCILHKDQVVSVIAGTCRDQNVLPIDIETRVEERGKGLGYAIGLAFIQDCFRRNLIPQWDCVESNPTSERLAMRLGFEKMRENIVYWFDL